MMATVLIRGKLVIVDSEFGEFVQSRNWSMRTNPSGQFYFSSNSVLLHRWIMGTPVGMVVAHINGDTLDNRKKNLRICTKLENQYNQKKAYGKFAKLNEL